MKNITNTSLKEDLELIRELRSKYTDAIWESQDGQSAHFDNQQKLVKICMGDIRCGLILTENALYKLVDIGVKED